MKFAVGDIVKIVSFYEGKETPYGPNRFEVVKADPESRYGGYTLRWLRPEGDIVGREVAEHELEKIVPNPSEREA